MCLYPGTRIGQSRKGIGLGSKFGGLGWTSDHIVMGVCDVCEVDNGSILTSKAFTIVCFFPQPMAVIAVFKRRVGTTRLGPDLGWPFEGPTPGPDSGPTLSS